MFAFAFEEALFTFVVNRPQIVPLFHLPLRLNTRHVLYRRIEKNQKVKDLTTYVGEVSPIPPQEGI